MKKFLAAISTVMLVAILALTMAGCDKSGNVKKALEKEGYTVTTVDSKDNEYLSALLNEEQKKEMDKYAVMTVTKSTTIPLAVIIKFPSENEIKEVLGDKYEEAAKSNFLNGNCYLIPIDVVVNGPTIINAFKNA